MSRLCILILAFEPCSPLPYRPVLPMPRSACSSDVGATPTATDPVITVVMDLVITVGTAAVITAAARRTTRTDRDSLADTEWVTTATPFTGLAHTRMETQAITANRTVQLITPKWI